MSLDDTNSKSKISAAKQLAVPLNKLSMWVENEEKILATYDSINLEWKRWRASQFTDIKEALLSGLF